MYFCATFVVNYSKVDCTANTEVCGKYGVSGYPTLKIFRNGELAEDYNGPREAGEFGSTSFALYDFRFYGVFI